MESITTQRSHIPDSERTLSSRDLVVETLVNQEPTKGGQAVTIYHRFQRFRVLFLGRLLGCTKGAAQAILGLILCAGRRFDWGAISLASVSRNPQSLVAATHTLRNSSTASSPDKAAQISCFGTRRVGCYVRTSPLSPISVGVCKPGACAICTSQCGTIIAFLPHSRLRLHVFHRGPLSNTRQLDAGAPPPLSLGGRRIMRQGVCVIGSGFLFVPLRIPPHFLSTKM